METQPDTSLMPHQACVHIPILALTRHRKRLSELSISFHLFKNFLPCLYFLLCSNTYGIVTAKSLRSMGDELHANLINNGSVRVTFLTAKIDSIWYKVIRELSWQKEGGGVAREMREHNGRRQWGREDFDSTLASSAFRLKCSVWIR